MAEPFIGEIRLFPVNFTVRGWARCDGQLLPINQNQALFSLLGTTYGGDGRQTFALPDLRGRSPMGSGQGAGLTGRRQGELFLARDGDSSCRPSSRPIAMRCRGGGARWSGSRQPALGRDRG
ncbi:MAG: tail fiber protein [bacterium]